MSDRIPMTQAGYDKLTEELKRLKTVDRRAISTEIEIARAHGDISENAEFHAAKEKQSHIEGRIRTVEDRLARAQVIEASGEPPKSIRFGVTADLEDAENGEAVSYTIVGEDEADLSRGEISVSSPVARALLGKAVGDSVTVRVPKGTREFEVLEIRYR
ncbi:MAG: transcription elongation factor GreA [Myxococcota bacterium]